MSETLETSNSQYHDSAHLALTEFGPVMAVPGAKEVPYLPQEVTFEPDPVLCALDAKPGLCEPPKAITQLPTRTVPHEAIQVLFERPDLETQRNTFLAVAASLPPVSRASFDFSQMPHIYRPIQENIGMGMDGLRAIYQMLMQFDAAKKLCGDTLPQPYQEVGECLSMVEALIRARDRQEYALHPTTAGDNYCVYRATDHRYVTETLMQNPLRIDVCAANASPHAPNDRSFFRYMAVGAQLRGALPRTRQGRLTGPYDPGLGQVRSSFDEFYQYSIPLNENFEPIGNIHSRLVELMNHPSPYGQLPIPSESAIITTGYMAARLLQENLSTKKLLEPEQFFAAAYLIKELEALLPATTKEPPLVQLSGDMSLKHAFFDSWVYPQIPSFFTQDEKREIADKVLALGTSTQENLYTAMLEVWIEKYMRELDELMISTPSIVLGPTRLAVLQRFQGDVQRATLQQIETMYQNHLTKLLLPLLELDKTRNVLSRWPLMVKVELLQSTDGALKITPALLSKWATTATIQTFAYGGKQYDQTKEPISPSKILATLSTADLHEIGVKCTSAIDVLINPFFQKNNSQQIIMCELFQSMLHFVEALAKLEETMTQSQYPILMTNPENNRTMVEVL